jgi:hypothetical protein
MTPLDHSRAGRTHWNPASRLRRRRRAEPKPTARAKPELKPVAATPDIAFSRLLLHKIDRWMSSVAAGMECSATTDSTLPVPAGPFSPLDPYTQGALYRTLSTHSSQEKQ